MILLMINSSMERALRAQSNFEYPDLPESLSPCLALERFSMF